VQWFKKRWMKLADARKSVFKDLRGWGFVLLWFENSGWKSRTRLPWKDAIERWFWVFCAATKSGIFLFILVLNFVVFTGAVPLNFDFSWILGFISWSFLRFYYFGVFLYILNTCLRRFVGWTGIGRLGPEGILTHYLRNSPRVSGVFSQVPGGWNLGVGCVRNHSVLP